jgi:OPA family sugar phosphate sensor protein UhpC-like MFS transporter
MSQAAPTLAPERAEVAPDPALLAGRARWVAWALTWVSYASYYLGRKGISVSKRPMSDALGADVLVGVESVYLAAYAVGMSANGFLGDRIGARRLIGFGMLLSAAACVAFGASSIGVAFLAAFLVNGLAQSSGWPGNIKAMAEWTTPGNRGRVMGFWATCYQVGGAAANPLLGLLLTLGLGWRATFFLPALWLALVGLAVLLFLKRGPGAGDATAKGEGASGDDPAEARLRAEERRRVLRSRVVYCYGGAYFGIKIIRYAILLWLPFYLSTALHYPDGTAASVSSSFEVGGVLGTIGMGFLSDRLRSVPRSVLASAWLVMLAAALYLYVQIGGLGMGVNFAAMALVGALLFGPDSLLSGAAAQDAGGKYAAGVAAGMVNGIGSVGAILQEALTRGVSKHYGWDKLFYVFVGLALFSAACLVPTFRVGRGR